MHASFNYLALWILGGLIVGAITALFTVGLVHKVSSISNRLPATWVPLTVSKTVLYRISFVAYPVLFGIASILFYAFLK